MAIIEGQIQDPHFVRDLYFKSLTRGGSNIPKDVADAMANNLMWFMHLHALQFIFIPKKDNDNEPKNPA